MDKLYEALPTDEADDSQALKGSNKGTTNIELQEDEFVELEIESAEEKEARRSASKEKLAAEAVEKLAHFDAENRQQKQNNGPLQQLLNLMFVIGHKLGEFFNFNSRQQSTSEQGRNEENCCLFTNPFTLLGPSTGQIKGRVKIGVEMEVVFTSVPVSTAAVQTTTLILNNNRTPVQPN